MIMLSDKREREQKEKDIYSLLFILLSNDMKMKKKCEQKTRNLIHGVIL
jgi:hypothetical protein